MTTKTRTVPAACADLAYEVSQRVCSGDLLAKPARSWVWFSGSGGRYLRTGLLNERARSGQQPAQSGEGSSGAGVQGFPGLLLVVRQPVPLLVGDDPLRREYRLRDHKGGAVLTRDIDGGINEVLLLTGKTCLKSLRATTTRPRGTRSRCSSDLGAHHSLLCTVVVRTGV